MHRRAGEKNMNRSSSNRHVNKRDAILKAARKLFSEKGYERTSVRDIVKEADTSMGNLYFFFPAKLDILKEISDHIVRTLRNQTPKVHDLLLRPEVGFALDFKIGYMTTIEDPRMSKLFLVVRHTPDIHQHSLENKRIRLKTFFGDRIPSDELNFLALAIQGIADMFFEQKKAGKLVENAALLSNTIIDYSLRLLGYSPKAIRKVIRDVETVIRKEDLKSNQFV